VASNICQTLIAGLCGSMKPLMLMGTAAADLVALDAAAAVDHRVAGFEEEARQGCY
jgi:hypothetical protein